MGFEVATRAVRVIVIAALAWGAIDAARAEGTEASEARVHVLAPGETVWRLARHYGVSTRDVLRANGITDATRLRPGTRLRIPKAGATVRVPGAPSAAEAARRALVEARFEQALRRADRALRTERGAARAQLEVVAATAHLAFGREREATDRLRRALAADPELVLAPHDTPRRLRSLFERMQGIPTSS